MKRNRLAALAVVAVALVGLACGSAKMSDYYTLQVNPPRGNPGVTAQKQVGVALPRATHLLRQDRIVYFTAENELNYYQYHRWAESPVFMVQTLLIQQLQGAGLFDNVVPYRAQKGLDYVLRGRLLAMEEVDNPSGITARFGLELELVRQEEAEVVWTGRESCERAVDVKQVESVVAALSGCAEESLGKLTRSLAHTVAQLEKEQEQEARR